MHPKHPRRRINNSPRLLNLSHRTSAHTRIKRIRSLSNITINFLIALKFLARQDLRARNDLSQRRRFDELPTTSERCDDQLAIARVGEPGRIDDGVLQGVGTVYRDRAAAERRERDGGHAEVAFPVPLRDETVVESDVGECGPICWELAIDIGGGGIGELAGLVLFEGEVVLSRVGEEAAATSVVFMDGFA
jgi:hypothetical protein